MGQRRDESFQPRCLNDLKHLVAQAANELELCSLGSRAFLADARIMMALEFRTQSRDHKWCTQWGGVDCICSKKPPANRQLFPFKSYIINDLINDTTSVSVKDLIEWFREKHLKKRGGKPSDG
jgi:hypothetical protein